MAVFICASLFILTAPAGPTQCLHLAVDVGDYITSLILCFWVRVHGARRRSFHHKKIKMQNHHNIYSFPMRTQTCRIAKRTPAIMFLLVCICAHFSICNKVSSLLQSCMSRESCSSHYACPLTFTVKINLNIWAWWGEKCAKTIGKSAVTQGDSGY